MAEEEQPLQQILPQLQPQKEEKKKRGRPPKQQQQQQIKADDVEIPKKKEKPALSDEIKELFRTFKDKYNFEWKNENSGFADTVVGDDIIFIRRIPNKSKGYAKYNKSGQYLIVKTNKEKFKKFKDNEVAKKEKEKAEGKADDDDAKEKKEDDIKFEYFNFSKDYFNKNEELFADSLKQKKFLFDNLDDEEKKEVQRFDWNDFKDLDIIPGISKEENYIDRLKKFNVETIKENNFGEKEIVDDKKGLFGLEDEEPIEEEKEEPLPKKEDAEIENDIYISDSEGMTDTDTEEEYTDKDVPEINVQDLQQEHKQQRKQQRQRKQLIQAQNNQLINAGHTPNGEELKALIKYNNNSDSLLKLIVSLSENNKGEVDFKEIGEIQDLNGDITNLYSDMQDLKSKINSSKDAEEKERLLIKYNKKRLELEDLIKKYSKEAYRLSTLKKKKATMATHKYLMNKLNKLKT